jgi:hypothetical protein
MPGAFIPAKLIDFTFLFYLIHQMATSQIPNQAAKKLKQAAFLAERKRKGQPKFIIYRGQMQLHVVHLQPHPLNHLEKQPKSPVTDLPP